MTATAQQVLEEIRRLPATDVRELCQAVLQLAAQTLPTPIPTQANGGAPVEGCWLANHRTDIEQSLCSLRSIAEGNLGP